MFDALPIDLSPSPALWEVKCLGLILIFIYTFFKFAWAYRLFNYVAILLGAMPPVQQRDTPEAEAHVIRTTRLFEAAGRHFNRGQRAFFFALGYLGWFVSPWVLFVIDRGGRDRDLAPAIRLQRLARDGELAPESELSDTTMARRLPQGLTKKSQNNPMQSRRHRLARLDVPRKVGTVQLSPENPAA